MAVRKQCNRYRTAPSGRLRYEVVQKAKRFFRTGLNDDAFMVWGECKLDKDGNDVSFWQSDHIPAYDCNLPNQRFYKWNGTRWKVSVARPA